MRKHLLANATAFAALLSMTPASPMFLRRSNYFVVPFAAGGPLDSLARALPNPGPPWSTDYDRERRGCGRQLGVGRAAHAAPDGYTVGVGNWSTHVLNGAIYTLQYNLLDDLSPVALPPAHLNSSLPKVRCLQQISASWSLAQSNKANVGTAGVGSATHVSGLLFQNIAKTQLAFVSYRSAGAALQDLVSRVISI